MIKCVYLLLLVALISCKASTIYVVRHAEKETATMSGDVPLSAAGQQRADALRDLLIHKNISSIYTTNYVRTKNTAKPLADAVGVTMVTYDPKDSTFPARIREHSKGNILIVGHSNTVDDLVNQITGYSYVPADLDDSRYGDLFIITKKKGRFYFENRHFGN